MASATGQIATIASTLRHSATASAGAAIAAISGPDVDTATIPTAISRASVRGGRPTVVKGTEGEDGEGILRIDFAEPDAKLQEIPWDEFFETFEDRKLAFLHQDKTADGKVSRFSKFVHRKSG